MAVNNPPMTTRYGWVCIPVDPSGQISVISIMCIISIPTHVSQWLGDAPRVLLGADGFPFRPSLEVAVMELVPSAVELNDGTEKGREDVYGFVLTAEEEISDGKPVLEVSDEDVLNGSLISVD